MFDSEVIRMPVHMVLHVAVPALLALLISRYLTYRSGHSQDHSQGYSQDYFQGHSTGHVFLLLLAGMLIDLDHLLANPVFDPTRCSVGFHPLHTWPAIVVYAVLLLPKWTRLLALGLLIHIGLDTIDCAWMVNS